MHTVSHMRDPNDLWCCDLYTRDVLLFINIKSVFTYCVSQNRHVAVTNSAIQQMHLPSSKSAAGLNVALIQRCSLFGAIIGFSSNRSKLSGCFSFGRFGAMASFVALTQKISFRFRLQRTKVSSVALAKKDSFRNRHHFFLQWILPYIY